MSGETTVALRRARGARQRYQKGRLLDSGLVLRQAVNVLEDIFKQLEKAATPQGGVL